MIDTMRLNLQVEKAISKPRVIWTPMKDWGDQVFVVRDVHYRWATKRETPHLIFETKYGDMNLREMTQWEIDSIGTPVFRRPKKRKKKR